MDAHVPVTGPVLSFGCWFNRPGSHPWQPVQRPTLLDHMHKSVCFNLDMFKPLPP